jgi:uncharacterized LabA/DUF88 family protein
MTTAEGNAHFAVLIDADNADASIIEQLLAEVSTFGVASVKRIYGDWTTPQLGKWKDTLLAHSIQPMQQFAYTTGKNATDSAMIIDAMDLLHTGTFDGFCLVSSDSDFTRLASRIREAGKRVIGFGEEKTPRAFVTACDQFIHVSVFRTPSDPEALPPSRRTAAELRQDTTLVRQLRAAVQAAGGESGVADLALVGSLLVKQTPDFDSRRYGYAKLSDLAEAIGLFTVTRTGGRVNLAPLSKREAPSVGVGAVTGAATDGEAPKKAATKKVAAKKGAPPTRA